MVVPRRQQGKQGYRRMPEDDIRQILKGREKERLTEGEKENEFREIGSVEVITINIHGMIPNTKITTQFYRIYPPTGFYFNTSTPSYIQDRQANQSARDGTFREIGSLEFIVEILRKRRGGYHYKYPWDDP
ncbi:hypothetical protein QE152_g24611 [Popillia japonica]|uniref:Uncharacterized protein n=1 Tax=Popillia japonica TaxID=7064 RepID=A0AAW1K505_POPJA